MRELVFLPVFLTVLAALVRARARVGALGVVGGLLAFAAFACGGYLDVPSPLRGAVSLYGIALFGKTLALGRRLRGGIGFGRGLAFLVLWPGLDPERAFVTDPRASRRRGLLAAIGGASEVLAGLVFMGFASRWGWLDAGPFVPAWCRLLSFGTFLHGGFLGMEGALEAMGFRPERIFREPWKARDLADFWGNRWNRFVGKSLALEVYAPAKRVVGRGAALGATFLVSGTLHEVLLFGSTVGPFGRYLLFFSAHGLAVAATVALRAKPGGRAFRYAVAWAILLATAPLFFGGCYPDVAPFERVFGAPR